jgi:hypothetical protein
MRSDTIRSPTLSDCQIYSTLFSNARSLKGGMCVTMLKNVRIVNVSGKEITNALSVFGRNYRMLRQKKIYQTPSTCPLSPTSYLFLPRAGYVPLSLQHKGNFETIFCTDADVYRYTTNAPSLYSTFTLCPGE